METHLKRITAVLGPTNTGKTHLAVDTMLEYKSGIFGFPLRLLARENYDRALQKIDKKYIALITGEEKIIPEEASYFFCTVESMPIEKSVEFVAIDEIQLISDFERGHIFTDRMLNLRGNFETLLLGSLTVEKILKKFNFSTAQYCDMNFHFKFIKIPGEDKLKSAIAEKIISNKNVGVISCFNIEQFLQKYFWATN